jgi:membrane-bound lytic murein transglycosylase D
VISPKQASDTAARRKFAGGPTADDVALGAESPELRAMAAAERELFPPATSASLTWPSELPSPLSQSSDAPRVHASGLPPAPIPSAPPIAEGGKDTSWLSRLQMPDLPVRWDARLVRFLEFFKDDPRGKNLLQVWFKRAGRYRDLVRRVFRKKSLPEDLVWLAMAESGFDPLARSPAGAVGLWQFMPETARAYGLSQDRWADQRIHPVASTEAAAEHLSDLHRRFGSWELAMAAYNMGYGGVQSVVRRYNTNDFWVLSRLEGALPWETTLYVPKIVALAIVARNPGVFGLGDLQVDPPMEGDDVLVPAGTPLSAVAQAAGCSTRDLELLNPELRAARTPPAASGGDYPVRVPSGKGQAAAKAIAQLKKDQPPLERYVVRFGETLEQIAQARKIAQAKIVEINGIAAGEVVRGGTTLLLPRAVANEPPPPAVKPVVVVPADIFVYPDRKRVFYRVVTGDTLPEIASAFKVSVDELRRWNDLDPVARLQEGMTLQIFAPRDADLTKVVSASEADVKPVAVGTEEFFSAMDANKNKKRITVVAKQGDTLAEIGKKHGVMPATMERINRRGRNEALKEGETVVLYVPANSSAQSSGVATAKDLPLPNGELPEAPAPLLLPPLP